MHGKSNDKINKNNMKHSDRARAHAYTPITAIRNNFENYITCVFVLPIAFVQLAASKMIMLIIALINTFFFALSLSIFFFLNRHDVLVFV